MQITVPTNITTGNTNITCSAESNDPNGPFTLFLVKDTLTRITLVQNFLGELDQVEVNIPANATGDGWTILATPSNNVQQPVGISLPFFIAAASQGKSSAGPVIGGVVAGVLIISLLVLAGFIYMRRRRQTFAGPEFNLEAGFPRSKHQGSFDSTSTGLADTGGQAIEMEKMQWEQQLEEQFARARAATPDIARGGSPMPRGMSPIPMPLAPQRAATRNPSY
ncbi:hypothetical protein B0H19DRAFT_1073322 [Mycena capillaripes]|nr:hypothetical protein B0H19DRAFT_1073322 [Mycena capillaripes]